MALLHVHAQDVTTLHTTFLRPPEDARPMVRWWWFGPTVTSAEITREIDQMHAGGFGGFELASVYPLALDDPAKGIRNLRYASPEMVAMLRAAQQHGRALGMRVDITLGSGWPFGGPHIPLEQAAGKLKVLASPLPLANLPKLEEGDATVSAFVADGTPEHWDAASATQVPLDVTDQVALRALRTQGASPRVALFFIASHTRQMVKRAAVGGEGYVLDHLSRQAIETHLHSVAEPLLEAFKDAPPTAVFSDSLEVYGSDWTAHLPEEFRRRRGYDLLPHLPELVQGGTPQADAVRHDWGVTLSELVRENYLAPLAAFASEHQTKFRSQTYGEPAATLFDEHTPQLPEGEGPQWNAFSYTRWASSANHVFGNNITSAETWTWLHSPAFRATPLDMKAEADRMFLQGVNQIIGHGWPYSPPYAQEPGYSLYAAAVFNAHNPWWPVMPEVTRYLQRVSWMLRQGEPVNDVALLLPEDDAQAAFRPGHVSVTDYMQEHITPALMQAMLTTGHNVDYIDGPALETIGTQAKLLVVPPTRRMRPATAQALENFVKRGGRLVFTGTVPSLAPGLLDQKDTPALREAISRLRSAGTEVANTAELEITLTHLLPADFNLAGTGEAVGFIHRHLAHADIYFVANTSPTSQTFPLHTAVQRRHAAWWDPETGESSAAHTGETVTLGPYESKLLVLDDGTGPGAPAKFDLVSAGTSIALTHWTATFPGSAGSTALPTQQNAGTAWTSTNATKFYSGEVRYSTIFTAAATHTGEHLLLRFANGEPLPDTQPPGKPGMRAWYDPPIREAAIIAVNGKRVGALWHPPYELDLARYVEPGKNTLEVRVYNTAINELAGQPPRDYTALNAKYGDRFQMQDMDNLQPVPSGIFGPVTLVRMKEDRRKENTSTRTAGVPPR